MRFTLVCAAASLLIACQDPTSPAEELAANRVKWTRAGLQDYAYEAWWSGAWLPPIHLRVYVSQGVVDSVVDLTTSHPTTPAQVASYAVPLETVFDWVSAALARPSDRSEVTYAPDLGYPARAELDLAEAIDDELYFTINILQAAAP